MTHALVRLRSSFSSYFVLFSFFSDSLTIYVFFFPYPFSLPLRRFPTPLLTFIPSSYVYPFILLRCLRVTSIPSSTLATITFPFPPSSISHPSPCLITSCNCDTATHALHFAINSHLLVSIFYTQAQRLLGISGHVVVPPTQIHT